MGVGIDVLGGELEEEFGCVVERQNRGRRQRLGLGELLETERVEIAGEGEAAHGRRLERRCHLLSEGVSHTVKA